MFERVSVRGCAWVKEFVVDSKTIALVVAAVVAVFVAIFVLKAVIVSVLTLLAWGVAIAAVGVVVYFGYKKFMK
jgi:hypothetical protein